MLINCNLNSNNNENNNKKILMRLDILAFGAHPDDVELGCSGTILKEISLGKKAGIIDLTRGELGTRGSAEIRDQEAKARRVSTVGIGGTPVWPLPHKRGGGSAAGKSCRFLRISVDRSDVGTEA